MINLVKFAENKDAIGFQSALQAAIAGKVTAVLDSLREKVAEDLFGAVIDEGSEESRQARAKRFAQKKKGKKEE